MGKPGQFDGGAAFANHQRADGTAGIIWIAHGGYYGITARRTRHGGGSIVGDSNTETAWRGGGRNRFGAAIISKRESAQSHGGRNLEDGAGGAVDQGGGIIRPAIVIVDSDAWNDHLIAIARSAVLKCLRERVDGVARDERRCQGRRAGRDRGAIVGFGGTHRSDSDRPGRN